MRVIPAIDLLGGAVVRLQGGDYATPTVYTRDPAEKAREFAAAGATLAVMNGSFFPFRSSYELVLCSI